MTYDPRNGNSPYLGMDDSYDEMDDLFDDDQPQGGTMRRQDGTGHLDTISYADDVGQQRLSRVQDTVADRIPKTIRRPARPAAGDTIAAPLDPRYARPAVASPAQRPYVDSRPDVVSAATSYASRPLSFLASVLLRLISLALRLAAIALSVLVVASAVLTGSHRAELVKMLNLTSQVIPDPIAGQFVFETPFGGALRGDLIIASIFLFLLDWVCLRMAARLREGARRY